MKLYLFFSFLFASIFSTPVSILAQTNSSEQHSTSAPVYSPEEIPFDDPDALTDGHIERESDTFQAKFINMLLILGLLIGFMILASWALKKMMKTKLTNLNTSNAIKLVETRYLSPRATLYLVEIEDQQFLIAESPTSVTHLATVHLPEEHAPFINTST